MEYEQNSHKSWLASCPVSDGNFKAHLKQASIEELQELINELPEQGNKTKLNTLNLELRKRLKE